MDEKEAAELNDIAKDINAASRQMDEMVIKDGPRHFPWADGNIYVINLDGSVECNEWWDKNHAPPDIEKFSKEVILRWDESKAKYGPVKALVSVAVRNLTTSHKQHHTAPDGRRYVDTGKGWRRV